MSEQEKSSSFKYKVLPELKDLGSHKVLEGILPVAVVRKGAQEYVLTDGINYELELSNTGDAVLLRGCATANAKVQCARCLEDANINIVGDVEGYYVFDSQGIDEELALDEYDLIDNTGEIDLYTPLMAALIFEIPQVVLCRPDCLGLCSRCGNNLNNDRCNCDNDYDPENPFYALKVSLEI